MHKSIREEGVSRVVKALLPDDILSLWVGGILGSFCTLRKDLPNSHKDVRSDTEVGNEWLFRD